MQADFLDILVFDSYVHELRKKEKAPEEAAESVSPRNATYHSTPPLSPLNLVRTHPPSTQCSVDALRGTGLRG